MQRHRDICQNELMYALLYMAPPASFRFLVCICRVIRSSSINWFQYPYCLNHIRYIIHFRLKWPPRWHFNCNGVFTKPQNQLTPPSRRTGCQKMSHQDRKGVHVTLRLTVSSEDEVALESKVHLHGINAFELTLES
jgi:hypothetical protein